VTHNLVTETKILVTNAYILKTLLLKNTDVPHGIHFLSSRLQFWVLIPIASQRCKVFHLDPIEPIVIFWLISSLSDSVPSGDYLVGVLLVLIDGGQNLGLFLGLVSCMPEKSQQTGMDWWWDFVCRQISNIDDVLLINDNNFHGSTIESREFSGGLLRYWRRKYWSHSTLLTFSLYLTIWRPFLILVQIVLSWLDQLGFTFTALLESLQYFYSIP